MKKAGRLDASEGGEDFCWMISLSPFFSATRTTLGLKKKKKKTAHLIACVCPNDL